MSIKCATKTSGEVLSTIRSDVLQLIWLSTCRLSLGKEHNMKFTWKNPNDWISALTAF